MGFNFIPNSVALKFDYFDNAGEGANSVGLYAAGTSLTQPSGVFPQGLSLIGQDAIRVDITYDGVNLRLTLTDITTLATWSWTKTVDLSGIIGGDTAYVGLTAGTGALGTTLAIERWTLTTGNQ